MKSFAILMALVVLGLPALAQDAPKKGGAPGTNIDMPFLMAPLTDAHGKLTGYAYISSRLTATTDAYALLVREKLPFIQDAFVRDVNGTSVAMPDDLEKVDVAGVEGRLLADASRIMGPGKVKLILVCTTQFASLHPVQTPAQDVPADNNDAGAKTPKTVTKSRCES